MCKELTVLKKCLFTIIWDTCAFLSVPKESFCVYVAPRLVTWHGRQGGVILNICERLSGEIV